MTGQTVYHYKILEKLGEGGMGVVYKALDTKLERTVALKFLHSHRLANTSDLKRFLREAKVVSKLDHPNIAVIHEISETSEGLPFICMAYYEGETLAHIIDQGELAPDQILNISLQILKGLEKAHAAGIVHRDIKPGNIVFSNDDNLKLVDFGIAKLVNDMNLTSPTGNVGTLPYMSPEQALGDEVDHRSDLFSFGIILYEMITGQHPFRGEYEQAVGYRLLNENPPHVSSIRPDIPDKLDAIVSRCLEKDRNRRFSSAAEIITDLEAVKEKPGKLKRGNNGVKSKKVKKAAGKSTYFAASGFVLLLIFSLIMVRYTLQGFLTAGSLPEERHLVVLPFVNLSSEDISESFSNGIQELLTSKITQLGFWNGALWVVPSAEVRELEVSTITEASGRFGINLAVTGSIQKTGDRLKVTINLVNASTLRQIDSKIIETDYNNISHFHDELIVRFLDMLEIEMRPLQLARLVAGNSADSEAYRLYLKGIGELARFENPANIQKAIENFEAAVEIAPGFSSAYAGLGEAFWRRFELTRDTQWAERAIANSRKALELDKSEPTGYVTLAMIYNGTGRFLETIELLNRALEINRYNAAAISELARAYEGLGELPIAEETYLRAIELRKTFWGGYNDLGRFYYRTGRYQEAAEQYKKVIEFTPDNSRGYSSLGAAYFSMGMDNEAVLAFEKSIKLQPNYSAFANLGTFYFFSNEFENTIRMYEQALEIQDTNYLLWGFLGTAYRWTDSPQKMKMAIEKALELAIQQLDITPEDPELLSQIASYHAVLGQYEEGLQTLQQLIRLDPVETDILITIGEVYEDLGERELALGWVERALSNGLPVHTFSGRPGLKDLLMDPRTDEILQRY